MYGVPDLMAVPQEQIETWKVYRPDGHLLSREEYPVARTLATGEVVHNEEFLLERWDGTRIPILANTAPLRDPSGTVLAAILIFTDISRLKEVETALQESNTRLRLGILETHDRVRNNLQIINAMLELSIDDADGTLPAADAKRLSRQILTLASVHNILTNEARFDRFGYDISSHTLLENLLPALDMEDMTGSVSCISDITDIPLSIPQATSLALVVNELMSNAVKQGGKHFEVTFAIADQEPGGESQPTSDPLIPPLAILQIREAGSDLPADFSFDTAAPTGLNIEQIVRFNLRGTLQITRHQDTASIEARVIFPLKFI